MKINLDKAIVHMVETMLPKGTKNKVFYTAFRVDYDNGDISTCNIIHFFFDCSTNYVKVGYIISGFRDNIKLNEDNVIVKFAGNHDSGWREFMSVVKKDLNEILYNVGINPYKDHSFITFAPFNKTNIYDAKLENVSDDNKYFNFKLVN